MTESGGTGFTDRQLGQLREIVRQGLTTLLTPPTVSVVNKAQATPFTEVDVNHVNAPQGKLTAANVNPVNKPSKDTHGTGDLSAEKRVGVRQCPHCTGPVTGKSTAVYCSDACRYAALSAKRKTARHLAQAKGRVIG